MSLLPARDPERLLEGGMCLLETVETDKGKPFQAMQFSLPPTLPGALLVRQALPQRGESRAVFALLRQRIAEPRQTIGPEPRGAWPSERLPQTGDSLLGCPLRRHYSTTQNLRFDREP